MFEKTVKYYDIEVADLSLGALADRALFVFLPENNRHVRLLQPLQPITEKVLTKLQRFEKVFSDQPSIDARIPKLQDSIFHCQAELKNPESAPYEIQSAICLHTQWLATHVFTTDSGHAVPVLFMHRLLGVPEARTLTFTSEQSVQLSERNLAVACLTACLAMWLGYCDLEFLKDIVRFGYCRRIGFFKNGVPVLHSEPTAQLLRNGSVPGIAEFDPRFKNIVEDSADANALEDELVQAVVLAEWLVGVGQASVDQIRSNRVLVKVLKQFDLHFEKLFKEQGRKAA